MASPHASWSMGLTLNRCASWRMSYAFGAELTHIKKNITGCTGATARASMVLR
jgi:hypothetical protein